MFNLHSFEKIVLIIPFLTILPLALMVDDQSLAYSMIACVIFIAVIPLTRNNYSD